MTGYFANKGENELKRTKRCRFETTVHFLLHFSREGAG